MAVAFEHLDGSVAKHALVDDPTPEDVVEKNAAAIRKIAKFGGSHAFDVTSDGFHVLKFVVVSADLKRPKPFSATARDDVRGGRVLLRNNKDIEAFAGLLFPASAQPLGSVPLTAYFAPLEGHSILAFPSSPSSPSSTQPSLRTLARLGIAKVIEIRLSDGKGKGKSPPRASEAKATYLIPGLPPNARRPSSSSSSIDTTSVASSCPSPLREDVHGTLVGLVARSRQISQEKRLMALEFLREFEDVGAIEMLRGLCDLPGDAAIVALTCDEFVRSMIVHRLGEDPQALDAVLAKVFV